MNRLISVTLGCLCIIYAAQCATLNQTVSAAVSTSMTKVNATIVTFNSTVASAETSALAALIAFATVVNQTIYPLLTKYSAYGVNATQVKTAIAGISEQLDDAKQTLQTFNSNLFTAAITPVLAQVQIINQTLNNAAVNLTTLSLTGGKNSVTCLTKYGAMLSQAPVSVDRINTCITAEVPRISALATNVTTIFSMAQTVATQMLSLINICSPVPNQACVQQFYTQFSTVGSDAYNMLELFNGFSAFSNTISFRLGRCAALVSADISVLSLSYTNSFVKCLTTGS
ncbi:uncharacterized protein LOC129731878 [Wyeomyia smithii]|uniref:uncharacterized protein LOC129731878 n=1 Tax=Wyeomyia smithii TaxID=174621 RepID=UPI002467C48E|nr:uncharacterized protein LOC129731878 [Wyeomyia smithii]